MSQPTCDDGAYTWQNVWTWKDGASRGAHLALAEVRGERHDLAAVRVLEPLQDDGRVQTAAVREDDL